MKFDHDKFFTAYKGQFGPISSQSQVDGIESMLTQLESDAEVNDERWAAYMFATVKHECDDKWQPIEEYGKGAGHPYGKPKTVTGSDGQTYTNKYYGRGYVQLTWDYNYQSLSAKLGLGDALYIHPEQVLEPDIAYKVMSYGMRNGTFTGKNLARYINATGCDYYNARKIINGLDRADLIKGYAQKLETCFISSRANEDAGAAGDGGANDDAATMGAGLTGGAAGGAMGDGA
jgi:putative chitinase